MGRGAGHCSRGPAILRGCRPSLDPPAGTSATRAGRPRRPAGRRCASPARIVVLGDLMLDVVLAPAVALRSGTDVPGRVSLVQGGSAANTARWLGRLGARSTLIAAVGRDATGRALVEAIRARTACEPHVARVAGARTGRIGVVVAPGGERSFVADRAAADLSRPTTCARPGSRAPTRSTCRSTRCSASRSGWPAGGRSSWRVARARRSASTSPRSGRCSPRGRRAARALIADVAPDLLFATASEAEAFLGGAERGRPAGRRRRPPSSSAVRRARPC